MDEGCHANIDVDIDAGIHGGNDADVGYNVYRCGL